MTFYLHKNKKYTLEELFATGDIVSVTRDRMNGKRYVWHANTYDNGDKSEGFEILKRDAVPLAKKYKIKIKINK